MAQNVPRELEERLGFASWRSPEPGSDRYQVQDPALAGDEIPSWTLLRSRRIHVPGAPPFLRSTWSRGADSTDPMLSIDIHVGESPSSARTLALRLLGDFQSPRVSRRTDVDVGEVAFGNGSPNWIVFVRGNLVVSVRNGGRDVVSVLEPAAALDTALMRKAGTPPGD